MTNRLTLPALAFALCSTALFTGAAARAEDAMKPADPMATDAMKPATDAMKPANAMAPDATGTNAMKPATATDAMKPADATATDAMMPAGAMAPAK
ncbi:hypothetical protein [Mesorhizobium sp. STM 4661]|uniref:hypothetical protein n=1 Tax=Mesorhizobium sp. STM 4661 TaxID=1297570 RepID=UPI0002BF351D|nr:hypothetical protein [Mesorhizobium sp. STM 4661]CCV10288.1 conserved exported hypothetical protein [Mesorhizobium sp. STM 4661]